MSVTHLVTKKNILITAVLLGVFSFFLLIQRNQILPSRIWMEYAMNIVREKRPTPPASSRFYAYVSSVYYDVLVATESKKQASLATAKIINDLYPDKAASSTTVLMKLHIPKDFILNKEAKSILSMYDARINQDIAQAKQPVRLYGYENWVGENPIEPSAGSWQRWIVGNSTFFVPPPPMFGSAQHKKATEMVKEAADVRTAEQGAAINFWGGVPGTEAPAGIWQNRLYDAVMKDSHLTDQKYAYAQKFLAQSVADSFMECWKVKYMYWTKRPNMVDPTITLAMNNPQFPSYVSGHSTVSRTAAEVLSVMFPENKALWLADAEEAKNSRLWAGIHFPYDNEIGADLGKQIGEVIIKKINLQEIK
jgi:hypothetical protein